MSPKVLLTFAFQLMMGCSSVPLPPFPSSLPPTAWKTCEATQTNRQKNRNQLANCTRRCPSPLTLTLTQALVETPTVQSVFCLAPAVAAPLSLSLYLLHSGAIVVWPPSGALNRGLRHTACVSVNVPSTGAQQLR